MQGRYLNTVFSQILVISVLKGLRRFVSQCSVGAYLIVKLNILFFVRTALEDAYPKINLLEKTSIHPYIQYQKARILKMIDDSGILPEKHDEEIQEVYKNVIWSIKTNPLYSCIQHTKSYAAILWIYGMRLIPDDIGAATRYLEDAKSTFEECGIVDAEYVNCLSDLLQAYLKSYGYTKNKSVSWVMRSLWLRALIDSPF